MSPIVRAKFRCMSVAQHWNDYTEVKLQAVRRDGKDAENDSFCQWTPSGEMRLMFRGRPVVQADAAAELEAGAYYYIDFERVASAPENWTLKSRTERDVDGNVELHTHQWGAPSLQEGHFQMWCTEASTREFFGAPSKDPVWQVRMSFAEASDYEAPPAR